MRYKKFINDKNLKFVNRFAFVGNKNLKFYENKDKYIIKKPNYLQKSTSSLKELLQWFDKYFINRKFFPDYILYLDLNYKKIDTLRIYNMYQNTIYSNYDSSTFVTESYKDFLFYNSNSKNYDFLNPNLLNKKINPLFT